MKKNLLLMLFGVAFFVIGASAQEKSTVTDLMGYTATADTLKGWKLSGVTGVTFGQTSLTNWAAGGENTVSGNATLNVSARYRNNAWFWDNNFFAEYGMVYSSANDWRKSADQINLNSVAGRGISKHWSFSALLNFKTQFANGYDYPEEDLYISTFMAPAYIDLALGMSYKPNDKYSLFISPLAERATLVLDDSLSNVGAFGVDPGDKVTFSTGAYLMASTNQTLAKDLTLISSVDMFTPYNSDFGNVDVNWNVLLNYKINKILTASLNTTLRYYDKEIQKVQFKEIFGLGMSYAF